MRPATKPEKSKASSRVQHVAGRKLLPVLLSLLAMLMLSAACSEDGTNSDNSTPTELGELEKALASGKPTLAGFVGDDCCKDIRPQIEELAVDYEGVYNILIIEAGEQKDLFNQYRITLTPTQIYFDSAGQEVTRRVGYWPKEEMVNRLIGMGGA